MLYILQLLVQIQVVAYIDIASQLKSCFCYFIVHAGPITLPLCFGHFIEVVLATYVIP